MQNISARAAEPKDAHNYMDWLKAASDINLVDTKVYAYPTCNTVVVERESDSGQASPVLMNSFHAVLMMEALAPKPGLEPKDEARALKELFEAVKRVAQLTRVREIWFGCKDERLEKFISKRGFEKVSFPMYRFKIEDAAVDGTAEGVTCNQA